MLLLSSKRCTPVLCCEHLYFFDDYLTPFLIRTIKFCLFYLTCFNTVRGTNSLKLTLGSFWRKISTHSRFSSSFADVRSQVEVFHGLQFALDLSWGLQSISLLTLPDPIVWYFTARHVDSCVIAKLKTWRQRDVSSRVSGGRGGVWVSCVSSQCFWWLISLRRLQCVVTECFCTSWRQE